MFTFHSFTTDDKSQPRPQPPLVIVFKGSGQLKESALNYIHSPYNIAFGIRSISPRKLANGAPRTQKLWSQCLETHIIKGFSFTPVQSRSE